MKAIIATLHYRGYASSLVGLVLVVLILNACTASDTTNHAVVGRNDQTPVASVVPSVMIETATAGLPTPDGTEQPQPTDVVPTEVAGAARIHSLVGASPDEVGKVAINDVLEQNMVRSGTPQVILARHIDAAEVEGLGIGCYNSHVIETPPLMLVVVKGDFDVSNQPGMSMAGPNPVLYVSYIAFVFDLWAGQPTLTMFSPDGRGLQKALNDPTLPSVTSSGTPTPQPLICPSPNVGQAALQYYGDTVSGIAGGTRVHAANFSTWHYYATKDVDPRVRTSEDQPIPASYVYVQVLLNNPSITGVRAYIDTNKQLLTQIAGRTGQVEVSIVFKDYVSVDQFRAFTQAHGLKTGVSYLRAIDEDPNPQYAPYYTIHIVGHQDSAAPLPQADVDNIYNGIRQYVPQLSLKGVYATHAWVDAKELTAIAADPSVYYVDLTATAVRDDLNKAGVAGAAQAVVDTPAHLIFIAMFEQPKIK